MTGLAMAGSGLARRALAQEAGGWRGGVPKAALPRMPGDIGAASPATWETCWVRSLLYDAPLRATVTGAIVAGLGIACIVRGDRRRVEIPVRAGVTFANGDPVTARDLAVSIERAVAAQTGDAAWRWSHLDGVGVSGDDRVILRLREPDVTLPATLATSLVPVMPAGTGNEHAGFPDLPPGTGPFVPSRHDGVLRLRRNPWFRVPGQPRFNGVDVVVYDEQIERTASVVTGTVDVVPDVPLLDIPLLQEDPHLRLHGGMSRRQCALVMRMNHAPLDDVRVRRLIAGLIDRESLVAAATAGTAEPSGWLFPPAHWAGPNDAELLPPASPSETRDALAGFGLLPGWPLRLVCPEVSPTLANVSILLQERFAAAGIALTVDLLDDETMRHTMAAGDFDLMMEYLPTWIDPQEIAEPWLHSAGARNVSGFVSLQMDHLLTLARTTPAEQRRGRLYQEMQRIVSMDMPLVPLFAMPWFDGVKTRVAGYEPALPASGRSLAAAWFEPTS